MTSEPVPPQQPPPSPPPSQPPSQPPPSPPPRDELRQMAITRLRKKRDFGQHLTAYVVINLVLNVIWLLTTPGGFYWPVFPLLGWGIGIVFHAIDTFSSPMPSEEKIQREMRRLGGG